MREVAYFDGMMAAVLVHTFLPFKALWFKQRAPGVLLGGNYTRGRVSGLTQTKKIH